MQHHRLVPDHTFIVVQFINNCNFGVQIEEKFPHQTKNWVYFCQGDLKWEDETIRQMLMTGLFGGVLFGMVGHEGGVILILCF
jgi:hypothetical protein